MAEEENPYIQALIASIEQICGSAPTFSTMPSIGDFNNIGGLLGIPTVLFGPAGENYHSADEYVDLQSVADSAEVLYHFLKKTNGGEL